MSDCIILCLSSFAHNVAVCLFRQLKNTIYRELETKSSCKLIGRILYYCRVGFTWGLFGMRFNVWISDVLQAAHLVTHAFLSPAVCTQSPISKT